MTLHRVPANLPHSSAHPGWLLLPLCLALGSGHPLRATHQEPSLSGSQTAPPASSALMRWWRGLGRHHLAIQTDGPVTRITEAGWGRPDRVYQVTRNSDGHSLESFAENGMARPVTDEVRRWAEAIQAAHASTPVPPAPPAPPEPPPPPPVPVFSQSEAGQSLLRVLQQDTRLRALLGSPISLDALLKGSTTSWGPGEPHGFRLFSPTGGATMDVAVSLHGPKGSASLRAIGERRGGDWTYSRLEAQPGQGGAPINLLSK